MVDFCLNVTGNIFMSQKTVCSTLKPNLGSNKTLFFSDLDSLSAAGLSLLCRKDAKERRNNAEEFSPIVICVNWGLYYKTLRTRNYGHFSVS